jgi:hypothetical protein
MDLIPAAAPYDDISDRMRQFAAARYMELITSLQDHVREALSDPAGIHDTEPARVQANVAVVKLHASLIKELGLLYRVQDRPVQEQEASMPLDEVARLLDEAQARQDAAVALAAAEAEARTLVAAKRRELLELEQARAAVLRGLDSLQH